MMGELTMQIGKCHLIFCQNIVVIQMLTMKRTPEQVAKVGESYTGQYLKQLLARRPARPPRAAEELL